MTKMKIGLVVLGLLSAVACGDSGDGDSGDTAGTNTGGGGTAGTNSPNSTGGDDAGTNGGNTSTNGSNTNGSTGDTNGTNTTAGDGDGGTTGGAEGACTNDADMAIIDGSSIGTLACEGAACAGLNLMDAPGQTMCIAQDAPTLKQLSPACQKCFDDITTCVPNECVQLLGGENACGISLPNTDFGKCSTPAATDAKCMDCNVRKCQPAFTACSGLQ